jgi:hypothetical protein
MLRCSYMSPTREGDWLAYTADRSQFISARSLDALRTKVRVLRRKGADLGRTAYLRHGQGADAYDTAHPWAL